MNNLRILSVGATATFALCICLIPMSSGNAATSVEAAGSAAARAYRTLWAEIREGSSL